MSDLPISLKQVQYWHDMPGTHLCYTISEKMKDFSGIFLVIVKNSAEVYKFKRELKFFLNNDVEILNLPDWEILPYDNFSPNQEIIAERITTLYKLQSLKKGILIVSVDTILQRLCPKEFILQNSFVFKINDKINLKNIVFTMEKSGYYRVSQVKRKGEYSVRGSILDLFPVNSNTPFRIDLFDDEIDNIRTFEVDTQRSIDKIDNISLLPAKEFPVTDNAIALFRNNWRNKFNSIPTNCNIYSNVSQNILPQGIEYYFPLFFLKTNTLFDYLPEDTLVFQGIDLQDAANEFYSQINHRYEQYRHDIEKPILSPNDLFIGINELFENCKKYPQITVTNNEKKLKHAINVNLAKVPDVTVHVKQEKEFAKVLNIVNNFKGRIFFAAESPGRQEVLQELLNKIGIKTKHNTWKEFIKNDERLAIGVASIDDGIHLLEQNILLICESDLLGKHIMQRKRKSGSKITTDLEILNLTELQIGDLVVHIDNGVARYRGLQSLMVGDLEVEFVTLEYAGGDRLYVPVTSLHLISRYSGGNSENAPIYKLGGERWSKSKKSALKQIQDVAADLLKIYAERESKPGNKMVLNEELYDDFSSRFPFEETDDQIRAISEVIRDLTANKSMDRVVCGDVGFGKTEVAMRAAFISVQNNNQVVVLVPTTLLAQQHYQTFLDRFADFPIKIDVLSRFRTAKEQKEIIEQLEYGKLDIVIGTHKLFSNNIKFKSLGLIIIDEEHRFGVKQKEKLKSLRAEVDILTLTATPIPRTLNMSMSGIRDLSIIATPPAKRLSIKTFINNYNFVLIEEAIQRELHRGGQVYYVHNNVDTIEQVAQKLQAKIPYAKVIVAHGQMRERELEQIMFDFYHAKYNVLVCTTIIETGIDIPNANTMIIERADKFGLAQLHQLRGRIGRSHHQAYAFLLKPKEASITPDAEKRLAAIQKSDNLGAGFTLATHDLEIRGAGELLGDEQSGHIQLIGFTLFMELLDKAVKTLKSGGKLEDIEEKNIEIDLQLPALIPSNYVADVNLRLVLYKRISSCCSDQEIDNFREEMLDRFGLLPEAVKYLLKITKYKLIAEQLGIVKLKLGSNGGFIKFNDKPKINPDKIIILLKNEPKKYQFYGSNGIKVSSEMPTAESRFELLENFFKYVKEK